MEEVNDHCELFKIQGYYITFPKKKKLKKEKREIKELEVRYRQTETNYIFIYLFNLFLYRYISKATEGSGRSSTDRQYFFINRRPVDLPVISKFINVLYRSVNKKQVFSLPFPSSLTPSLLFYFYLFILLFF
jgi:DNA mismatch repair ATPase MutL